MDILPRRQVDKLSATSNKMSLSDKVVFSVIWRFLERAGGQVVHFVITLILARLLAPQAFGVVALLSIFISISSVLVSAGLGTALVQKKDVTQTDYATVFYLNLFISVILYFGLFLSAPLIADFYHEPQLVLLLRILAFSVVITGLNCVQGAVLQREMLFKKSFKIGLLENVSTGIVGCCLAWIGAGPWALVMGTLSGQSLGCIARWVCIHWFPTIDFSMNSAVSLFCYGWKVLVTSLCNTSLASVYGLVIGRIYTPADLAIYNRGMSIPNQAMEAINGSITTVSFPVLSHLQDDRSFLLRSIREMIRTSSFFVCPLMFGLAVSADSVVKLLLGDNWNAAIPFIRVFAIMYSFSPATSITYQALLAQGKSGLTLMLEILKNILALVVLTLCVRQGVLCLAYVVAFVSAPVCLLLNYWPNRKLVGYGLWSFILDFTTPLILSAFMGIVVFWVNSLLQPGIVCLLAQAALGIVIYVALSFMFQRQQIQQVIHMFKRIR